MAPCSRQCIGVLDLAVDGLVESWRVGDVRGWLPDTIDAWDAGRPGRGNWK